MNGKIDSFFGFIVVESNASRIQMLEFVRPLRLECENKSLYDAWSFCGGNNKWLTNGHIS